jgi:hypothetical protein
MIAGRACLVVLGATLLGISGCGGDDESLVGQWTGAFRDNLGGIGGGSFTITQHVAGTLQGSWQVFFQLVGISAGFNNDGSLTGIVEGSALTGALTSQGPCPFSFQARVSGRIMAGSYTTGAGCSAPETGTFDLEKR